MAFRNWKNEKKYDKLLEGFANVTKAESLIAHLRNPISYGVYGIVPELKDEYTTAEKIEKEAADFSMYPSRLNIQYRSRKKDIKQEWGKV